VVLILPRGRAPRPGAVALPVAWIVGSPGPPAPAANQPPRCLGNLARRCPQRRRTCSGVLDEAVGVVGRAGGRASIRVLREPLARGARRRSGRAAAAAMHGGPRDSRRRRDAKGASSLFSQGPVRPARGFARNWRGRAHGSTRHEGARAGAGRPAAGRDASPRREAAQRRVDVARRDQASTATTGRAARGPRKPARGAGWCTAKRDAGFRCKAALSPTERPAGRRRMVARGETGTRRTGARGRRRAWGWRMGRRGQARDRPWRTR